MSRSSGQPARARPKMSWVVRTWFGFRVRVRVRVGVRVGVAVTVARVRVRVRASVSVSSGLGAPRSGSRRYVQGRGDVGEM